MPNLFSKHLHLCFFKLKNPAIPSSPPSSDHHLNSSTFHFNSTYNYDATSSSSTTDDYFSSSSNSSSDFTTTDLPLPDFASIFASQRFFFSSPGTSNSIVQSPDTRPYSSIPGGGGVRVPKYSVNPYLDFLRSMQEMIHSHHVLIDVRKDWDYLHELLLCYLALNPQHTHKYIVRAFTDLVVDLLSSSGVKNRHHRRQSSFSGRLV